MWEARSGGLASLAPAASSGDGVCWQHPACAGVAAGLDRPALCLVSQHPAAKGSVEPVFPMAQPPRRGRAVILSVMLASVPSLPLPHGGGGGQGSFSNRQPLLAPSEMKDCVKVDNFGFS